ncbi:hypothetical protein XOC_0673 [Xanthomonas oryzae pv. oryzicola BLS256]|uniref:Uncharacterized protein n=1 Tax=Xanthomonas oryzae pv. oryzicola (strain BLS256) TaxID=383407 RepID=G7TBK1_XANOB|nr:hypothetical protein XOC_0673 [Xanthomonas oryzae pv. oryzicola BLS256]
MIRTWGHSGNKKDSLRTARSNRSVQESELTRSLRVIGGPLRFSVDTFTPRGAAEDQDAR